MSVAAREGYFIAEGGIYRLPTAKDAHQSTSADEGGEEDASTEDDASSSEIEPFIRRLDDAAA